MAEDWDSQLEIVWLLIEKIKSLNENQFQRIPSGATQIPSTVIKLYDLVKGTYRAVSESELRTNKSSKEWSFPNNTYLIMFPENKGGWKIPILRVTKREYDGAEDWQVISYKIAIFLGIGEPLEPKAIGIRFESPESPPDKGDHDYYHAQLFSSFEKDGQCLPDCPNWLPESMPAIALNEVGPLPLFLCLLKSFYGSKHPLVRNALSDQFIKHHLNKYKEHMSRLFPPTCKR